MTNVLVLIFAILLCLVNAVVWMLVTEMPFMSICWGVAAVVCIFLHKWTRG